MIDHVKLLVVDGEAAVVGGINWGRGSAGNHDFDALIRGPAARNLQRVFVRDLVTCGVPVAIPPMLTDTAMLVAATLPQEEIRPLVLTAIEGANRSIDLQLFVLTDLGIVHALERALARGVMIHLLLDPGQRPSDAAAAELRAAGVEVRVFAGAPDKLHAKAAVVDGVTTIFGSANWTAGGFQRNHEVDVEVLDAPAIASLFLAPMTADWAAAAAPP